MVFLCSLLSPFSTGLKLKQFPAGQDLWEIYCTSACTAVSLLRVVGEPREAVRLHTGPESPWCGRVWLLPPGRTTSAKVVVCPSSLCGACSSNSLWLARLHRLCVFLLRLGLNCPFSHLPCLHTPRRHLFFHQSSSCWSLQILSIPPGRTDRGAVCHSV